MSRIFRRRQNQCVIWYVHATLHTNRIKQYKHKHNAEPLLPRELTHNNRDRTTLTHMRIGYEYNRMHSYHQYSIEMRATLFPTTFKRVSF